MSAHTRSSYLLIGCVFAASAWLVACGGGSVDGDGQGLAESGPPRFIESRQDHGTGPITFTFNFTEKVKNFDASDVQLGTPVGEVPAVAANGTKGTFFFDSTTETFASLVVTPGDESLPVMVRVAIGAFQDLAGNSNVVEARHTHPGNADTTPPGVVIGNIGSPYDFDKVTAPTFSSFGDATATYIAASDVAARAAEPVAVTGDNATGFVKVARVNDADGFEGGTIVLTPLVVIPGSPASGIPFSATKQVIKVRVFSTVANTTVRLVVENNGEVSPNDTTRAAADATTGAANAWEYLSFNFANNPNLGSGTSSSGTFQNLNLSSKYDRIRIVFGVGRPDTGAGTYYFDDVGFPVE